MIVEEPGVSATALPKNICGKEDTRRVGVMTKPSEEESCEKSYRGRTCYRVTLCVLLLYIFEIYADNELFGGGFNAVMPNFAEVYSFIGSVFDPNTSGHLQRLKQMDPINMETV